MTKAEFPPGWHSLHIVALHGQLRGKFAGSIRKGDDIASTFQIKKEGYENIPAARTALSIETWKREHENQRHKA